MNILISNKGETCLFLLTNLALIISLFGKIIKAVHLQHVIKLFEKIINLFEKIICLRKTEGPIETILAE